jgi:hypothetical protein
MNTTAPVNVHKNETPGNSGRDSLARREWFKGNRIDRTSDLFPPPASRRNNTVSTTSIDKAD